MLYFSIAVKDKEISVPKCITVYNDGTWDITVVGKNLNCWMEAFSIPKVLNTEAVSELVSEIAKTQICQGNADYVDFVRKSNLRNYIVDSHFANETVRHVNCQGLLLDGDWCSVCKTTRKVTYIP